MKDYKIKKYKWKNAIILRKTSFNNRLLDMAKFYLNDNYEVSVFRRKRFSNLIDDKYFKENAIRMGDCSEHVYVANKKDSLKKYSEYIEKSITEKQ